MRDALAGALVLLLSVALFAASCSIDASTSSGETPSTAGPDSPAEAASEPTTTIVESSTTTTEVPAPPVIEIGNGLFASSAGNLKLRPGVQFAMSFEPEDDSAIDTTSFVIKYDFEREGYHVGDCGDLVVAIHADDGTGQPLEEPLASQFIAEPCTGERPIGWLTTLTWAPAIPVSGGSTYHLVYSNPTDGDGWVSINQLYDVDADVVEALVDDGITVLARGSESYAGGDGTAWGSTDLLEAHRPVFEIGLSDGSTLGNSYVGVRRSLTMQAGDEIRQQFEVDEAMELERIRTRPVDQPVTDGLVVRVETDDGDVVAEGVLRGALPGWLEADMSAELSPGQNYAVVIEALAGPVTYWPLYRAAHDDWDSAPNPDWSSSVEVRSGDTWQLFNPGIAHDLPLLLTGRGIEDGVVDAISGEAMEETPPAASVVVLGDSLVSSGRFESSLRGSLSPEAELDLVLSEGGRVVEDVLAAPPEIAADTDAIIVSLGINGGSTGEQFESAARSLVALLAEQAPEAQVLWIELAATNDRYATIVEDRVVPRNDALGRLADEGLIVLVPWASYVAERPGVFAADGVHHHGNEAVFGEAVGEFVAAAVG